jgi:hypothetical protein
MPPPTITIGFPLVRSATQYILPFDREMHGVLVGDERLVYRPAKHVRQQMRGDVETRVAMILRLTGSETEALVRLGQ